MNVEPIQKPPTASSLQAGIEAALRRAARTARERARLTAEKQNLKPDAR